MLTKVLDRVHDALRLVVGLLFTVLLGAVVVQVVSRLMLPNPPVWTEELSRFSLILVTALGCGLALRSGELVGVDLITAALPRRLRAAVEALGMAVVTAFCALLVPPALDFVEIGALQTSPALGWNMVWMHLSVLIAPLALGLACVARLITLVRVIVEAP